MAESTQPVMRADLDDPRVQSGDVQAMQDQQRAIPLPRAAEPSLAPVGSRRAQVEEARLPDFMFDMGTNRPEEPITAGLAIGPGPGPEALDLDEGDPRIALLSYFADNYDSREAAEMRNELLNKGQAVDPVADRMAAAQQVTPADAGMDDDFFGAEGDMFAGSDLELPAENPDDPAQLTEPVVDEAAPTDQEILDEETLVPADEGEEPVELEPEG